MNGRTPDEVFASGERPVKQVDPETLALALTKPFVRKVRKNGVQISGVDYWAPELFQYAGREVLVRIPLANPDEAIVMDPKGKMLCTARADWFAETRDISEDNRRVSAARKANMEMIRQYGVRNGTAPRIPFLPDTASYELPLAAGAEHQHKLTAEKSSLKNPLDI